MTNTALEIRRLEVEQEVTRMMREAADLYAQMEYGPDAAVRASSLWDKYGLNDDSSMPADKKLYLSRQALDEVQAEHLAWRLRGYDLSGRADVCEACEHEALGNGFCTEHALERLDYLGYGE